MASLRLLVVDDALAILALTAVLVACVGYAPHGCRPAATARALVAQQPPALAISDLRLKQPAAGRALVTTLRQDAPLTCPFWSADPRAATTVVQCQVERMAVHTKPVLPAEVVTLVNQRAQPSQPG